MEIKKLIMIISVVMTSQVYAFKPGKINLSGTGCASSEVEMKAESSSLYKVPMEISFSKDSPSVLVRKQCQFSWPIQLNPKEKLQILNVSQTVQVSAFEGANVKASLSVSVVGGEKSKIADIEVKDAVAPEKVFKQDGVVFETKCGKDIILRGLSSAFIQGTGRGTVRTKELSFEVKGVSCN